MGSRIATGWFCRAGSDQAKTKVAGSKADWPCDADCFPDGRRSSEISRMVEAGSAVPFRAAVAQAQIRRSDTSESGGAGAAAWNGNANLGKCGGAFPGR